MLRLVVGLAVHCIEVDLLCVLNALGVLKGNFEAMVLLIDYVAFQKRDMPPRKISLSVHVDLDTKSTVRPHL